MLVPIACLYECYKYIGMFALYTDDEVEELLILRPVGPGIQDLETGDIFAASCAMKQDGKCDN